MATGFVVQYESSCVAGWFLSQDPAGRYRSRFCISDPTLVALHWIALPLLYSVTP